MLQLPRPHHRARCTSFRDAPFAYPPTSRSRRGSPWLPPRATPWQLLRVKLSGSSPNSRCACCGTHLIHQLQLVLGVSGLAGAWDASKGAAASVAGAAAAAASTTAAGALPAAASVPAAEPPPAATAAIASTATPPPTTSRVLLGPVQSGVHQCRACTYAMACVPHRGVIRHAWRANRPAGGPVRGAVGA
jgi:hypothetical protein